MGIYGTHGGGSANASSNDLTAPVESDFVWVNQGDATKNFENGILYLQANPGAGEARMLLQAVPATPYVVTACFSLNLGLDNYSFGGLVLRNSGNGKLMSFRLVSDTILKMSVSRYSDANTGTGNDQLGVVFQALTRIWLRIADNGATRSFHHSVDGINFIQFFADTHTTYLTADQIGIAAGAYAVATGLSLLSWNVE